MNIFQHPLINKGNNFRAVAGLVLILSGAILFLDRYLKTGWLSFAILPAAGIFFFYFGLRQKNPYLILAGGILGGGGAGIAAAFNQVTYPHSPAAQVGIFLFYLGIGWLIITATTGLIQKPLWWALVPTGVLVGVGYFLTFSQLRWVDFVLALGLGAGVALLAWGLVTRLIGLVIPGCLLVSTGMGIFYAWRTPGGANSLVNTGIMLVWFALGWALITLSGRLLIHRFLWWPLIPGGILAVVGYGLYIGGDPDNALNFISNTGSIALMIFGLYLLLMRKGIHH
jgi:hypothetical protein